MYENHVMSKLLNNVAEKNGTRLLTDKSPKMVISGDDILMIEKLKIEYRAIYESPTNSKTAKNRNQ